MCKEFSVAKRLKFSKGVRVFISGLFLATLFFYGAFCVYSENCLSLNDLLILCLVFVFPVEKVWEVLN
ncbi:TPA: hypothetical protein ACIS1N_004746, partial [Salmonella enterica subsp. enterica serovar Muenchen]